MGVHGTICYIILKSSDRYATLVLKGKVVFMGHIMLREIRNERGLTQQRIADVLQVSREAYSMYENGKRQINSEALCILADYYSVTTDLLLGREEKMPINLTKDEIRVIERYRKLDSRGKNNILGHLEMEQRQVQK